ncbi:MAG: NAD(P)-dependent oxidoreductase [Lachnospiraceae bacterium]|nr:NAD(P)-dependent oxidoreductase [Lachnospiraceae bacterium]
MRSKRQINVLITGATGFIGKMVVDHLISSQQIEKYDLKLLLPVRDISKAENIYCHEGCKRILFIESDITSQISREYKFPVDYIIHCAAVTQSSYMVSNPVESADSIVLGTRNILELAKEKQIKSMVFVSSMEVYGNIPVSDKRVPEEVLGDVDIFNVRSCYPLAKRMAEHYCYDYFREYGVPVKIARLAQTFGTGVPRNDTRVFAQFARSVINNEDIVLHTLGNSMGNYCATEDTVSAIFTLLEKGENGEAYNVVNEENTMSIREMADLVAKKVSGNRIHVTFDIAENANYGYAPNTGLRLSSEKLCKLGWKPTKDLSEMYRDLIQTLK